MTTRRDFLTGAAYLTVGAAAGATLARVATDDGVALMWWQRQLVSTKHPAKRIAPVPTLYRWVTAEDYLERWHLRTNAVVIGHSTLEKDMVLIAYREDGSPVPWADHTPPFPIGWTAVEEMEAEPLHAECLEEVMLDIGC